MPGPYIKDFLKDLGHEGLNNLLAAYENKSATALCTFAYCATPESEPILFEGRTRGKIVPARGPGRFGWDPIFEVEGLGQTSVALSFPSRRAYYLPEKTDQIRRDGPGGEEQDLTQIQGPYTAQRVSSKAAGMTEVRRMVY